MSKPKPKLKKKLDQSQSSTSTAPTTVVKQVEVVSESKEGAEENLISGEARSIAHPGSYHARPPTLAATVNYSWSYPRYPVKPNQPPVPAVGEIVTLTWKNMGSPPHRWRVTLDLTYQIEVRLSPDMGQELNEILHSKQGYGFSSDHPVLFLSATYFSLDDAIDVANALDAATQSLARSLER